MNMPFSLITQVDVVEQQQAWATVIAPWWPAQPWFQRLRALSVHKPLPIPNTPKAFIATGPVPETRNWRIYAWRVFRGSKAHDRVGLMNPAR